VPQLFMFDELHKSLDSSRVLLLLQNVDCELP
jgi:hypothetical protein